MSGNISNDLNICSMFPTFRSLIDRIQEIWQRKVLPRREHQMQGAEEYVNAGPVHLG